MTGDRLIIMTYGQFTPEELKTYCPTVVPSDEKPGGEVRPLLRGV